MLDSEKIIQDAIKLHDLEIKKKDIEIEQLKHENEKKIIYLTECKNCGNTIKTEIEINQKNIIAGIISYVFCDSCETIVCMVCGKELTSEENF